MSTSRNQAIAIATRYATAIFSLASEAGKEDVVTEQLSALADVIQSEKELASILANPLMNREKKASLLQGLAKHADKLTQQALATVASQGRAEVLPYVAEQLRAKLAASRGEILADVESARPLPAAVQKQLAEALAASTGKKVQLNFREDPELLGGVAIQVGSLRLDATLAHSLNNLRSELLSSDKQ